MTRPVITALPPAPLRGEDAATFAAKANTFVAALPAYGTESNALGVFMENEADAAQASRIAAEAAETGAEAAETAALAAQAAAEAASNAAEWVSGQAYLEGDVVWSPITYTSYRANTNTSGTTDPSLSSSWTSVVPAGGVSYLVKTANYTAKDKEGVLADTSGGAFTVTLPATPEAGDQVVIADSGNSWGTNNLTVGRNGSTIGGLAENLVCDITGVSVQFVYDGSTWEVYAQIGGNSGSVVTLNDAQTLTNKTINGASNTLSVRLANDVTGTLPIANGGTGLSALGTAGQLLKVNSGATALEYATITSGFTLGTPTTASGNPIDFTGIPVGVKQVIVTFTDVNFAAGADQIVIRLGVAGGVFPFAYSTFATVFNTSGLSFTLFYNGGFMLPVEGTSTSTNGQYILTLQNPTTNSWAGTGVSGNVSGNQVSSFSSGRQNLTGPLAAIRIASRLGNSYSSGTINIAYI